MKRRILLVLIAMISSTAIILSIFFGISFSSEMNRFLLRERREVNLQIQKRLHLLEEVLSIVEQPIRSQAESRLQEAYENLLQIEPDMRNWDDTLLIAEARMLGNIELYLIDADLVIRASSFSPDRGLDLGHISSSFSSFLHGLIGSGEVMSQRLTASIATGALNIYSYYGPEDQDFILQLSVNLDDYLRQNQNEFAPSMLFTSLLDEYGYVIEADLFTYDLPKNWSIVSGEEVKLSPHVLQELKRTGQYMERDGDRLIAYQRQNFLGEDNPIGHDFVFRLYYDMGYYRRVLRRFYLRGGLITLILITMASGLTGLILDRQLIRKIETLHAVLHNAHAGEAYTRLNENQGVREFAEIAGALNAFMDSAKIREHQLEKHATDLSSALHQRDVLLREIHHRVKNNLQIIISLISIEQSRVTDSSAPVFEQISTRVRAMSAVHEILYEADNLEGAQLEDLVERVFRSVLSVYGMNTIACSFSYNVPDLLLPVDIAIPLSLVLTEAITNSLKYSNCNSELGIRLKMTAAIGADGKGLELVFSDNGVGFPPEAQFSDGFGFILMRGLAEQMGGRLETMNDNGAVIKVILADFTSASSQG